MSELSKFIEKLSRKQNLSVEESTRAFQILLSGGVTPAQISALLMALKMKGETSEEITGAAISMRAKAEKFKASGDILDTCGTGGDGSSTLNISTAVAFVVAGAGVKVAKHGNKAVSSNSGSADVLKELGIKIDMEKALAEKALDEIGLTFLFAPKFHTALRDIGPVRQELGIRTIFNVLGPLTNPAGAKKQLMGVYSKDLVRTIAEVLKNLGSISAMVVHGADGLDEITTTDKTYAAFLSDGEIKEFEITPEQYGFEKAKPESLKGRDARHNASEMLNLFSGKKTAYRDIVLLNSAAALLVSGKVNSIEEGVKLATNSVDSGAARRKLDELVELTNRVR